MSKNGKLGWGGYLDVVVPEKNRKVVNQIVEDGGEPALTVEYLVTTLMEAGFSLKVSEYGGDAQWTAFNVDDQGDGLRYGVSAYGPTVHLGLLILYYKLEGLEFKVPGNVEVKSRGSAWG